MINEIPLIHMKSGEKGIIAAIQGGHGMIHKLDALGIRCGVELKKVSRQPMRGPVLIEIGNTQIAIGYGMAQRIVVEIKKSGQN